MEEVETPQLDRDTWQDVADRVFWDIAEQHGLQYAVTAFLTTLGIAAVDTNTVGELMASMEATIQCAIEELASGTVSTTTH